MGSVRIASGCAAVFLALSCAVPAAADFVYADFSSTAGLALLGEAQQVGDVMRLTAAGDDERTRGGIYFLDAQEVAGGFVTNFRFQITDSTGGDGLAFVIQPNGTNDIGDIGNGLGYNRIDNSVAVEFDTRQDPIADDPSDNHISVNAGLGVDPGHANHNFELGHVDPAFNLDDGAVHDVRIIYLPGSLRVFVDDFSTPLLGVSVDLTDFDLIGGTDAFVGLTSGLTGPDFTANHDILSWGFTSGVAVPEPSSCLLLGLGAGGLGAGGLLRRLRRRR